MSDATNAPSYDDAVRWADSSPARYSDYHYDYEEHIANAAYAAGYAAAEAQRPADPDAQAAADAELEACCAWVLREMPRLDEVHHIVKRLRAARRPPAPCARDAAIEALRERINHPAISCDTREVMEKALRALEGGDG